MEYQIIHKVFFSVLFILTIKCMMWPVMAGVGFLLYARQKTQEEIEAYHTSSSYDK